MPVRSSLLVLAGAGASTAVNREQFPTTVDFFSRLPTSISHDPLFKLVMDFLASQKGNAPVDIEEVLWSIRRVLEFFGSTDTHEDIIAFGLSTNRFAQLVNDNYTFGHFSHVARPIQASARALMAKINAMVYDLYGYTPSDAEISKSWATLFKMLPLRSLDIFTTNYDIVIETAVDAFAGASSAAYTGVAGGRHKYIDVSQWHESTSRDLGLLTKLHGSIDWKVSQDKIYVGDPVFTGDHSKQAIIYPGFKGAPEDPTFKAFHDYFERSLSTADALIVIGFAFRDDYINNSIRNNLAPDVPVIVINPDKSVRFPYGRSVARYLHVGFDDKSLTKALRLIADAKPPKRVARKLI